MLASSLRPYLPVSQQNPKVAPNPKSLRLGCHYVSLLSGTLCPLRHGKQGQGGKGLAHGKPGQAGGRPGLAHGRQGRVRGRERARGKQGQGDT